MDRRELYHHGTKGMKWGRRRYQNKDGSLTEAGKKRYARDASQKGYKDLDDDGTYYKKVGKKGGRKETLDFDANRYVREDRERSKRVMDETANLARASKNLNDKAIKRKSKNVEPMDLSNMTDKEMRDQINRAILERQYNEMFSPKPDTRGRERVSEILETAGDVLVVASSAVGLALAIQKFRNGGD